MRIKLKTTNFIFYFYLLFIFINFIKIISQG